MTSIDIIGSVSILTAGFTMAIGSIGPAFGESMAASKALMAMAQQPDETKQIMRTLFISLAMIESVAIYCLVISTILIFANPFWEKVIS